MNETLTLPNQAAHARNARSLFDLLDRLQDGRLEIRLPDGCSRLFGTGLQRASLQVHDDALFDRVLARGDIGFAEAYLDGQWDSPDPALLLTLLANNREALRRAIYGHWRSLLAARLRHWLNRNSRAGSRRNILAHYDLGNAFYRLWLDPGMSYSSALYGGKGSDLAAAQAAKYARILDRLQATPGDSVLEVGCGWGGFAEAAVARDLQVTGVTLSPSQLAWARERVPAADLRLQDYRDVGGQYDHLVSIEMFEAVGERWWPTYFRSIARALKPGGRALIQTITVRDDLFAAYRRGTDFIQQYVFPGGMLPSPAAFRRQAHRAGLAVRDEFAFGLDYARTLAAWRERFEQRWPEISALGFDERFRRLWRLYLCYCEAGFRAGSIDVVQFELAHR
jgi:cyclopropane-fatty-acyl-phospholipid synthase